MNTLHGISPNSKVSGLPWRDQRVVGEQRALARQQRYVRLLACLPSSMPADLDALVQVEETPSSPLHALKAPPGLPSPRALLRLIAQLDQIQAPQVLTLDLTWLNPNLPKALAQHVWPASAHRLRGLPAPQRYTVLVCFLIQTYRDTLDQLVEMRIFKVTPDFIERMRARGLNNLTISKLVQIRIFKLDE